jgi:histone acetyltransferase MYST2
VDKPTSGKQKKLEAECEASRATRGKGKSAGKGKASGKADVKEKLVEEKTSPSLSSYVPERRAARVVAEASIKYSADAARCPMPGCDSKGMLSELQRNEIYLMHSVLAGHITGKHETHRTISACPLYHNLTTEECKVQYTTLGLTTCYSLKSQ